MPKGAKWKIYLPIVLYSAFFNFAEKFEQFIIHNGLVWTNLDTNLYSESEYDAGYRSRRSLNTERIQYRSDYETLFATLFFLHMFFTRELCLPVFRDWSRSGGASVVSHVNFQISPNSSYQHQEGGGVRSGDYSPPRRLISRDRQTKYCVCLKILTNVLFFCSVVIFPEGIGIADYSGNRI